MDIVSIGNILKETIVGRDGQSQLVLGSPTAYSSVCAACLGISTGIVTNVGKDMPENLLKVFYDAGVDMTGFDSTGQFTTTNELGYDDDGRKRILRYHAKAAPITWKCIPEKYYDSKMFYICGVDFEIDVEAIEKITTLGGFVAGDLGGLGGTGRPLGSFPPMKQNKEAYRRIVANFDIVKVSEDDCILITGDNEEFIPDFIRQVISWGPKTVLLTRGAKGTDVYDHEGVARILPFKVTDVLDTTGAGDCFMAGFLCRYIKTGQIIDSVRYGSAVASWVIQKTGGVIAGRMPTSDMVESRLKYNG